MLKAVGLNIEDAQIRASIVSTKLGIVKHLKYDEIKMPADAEEKREALRNALAAWKEEHGINGVVVGLGFIHFSHYFVELPVKSKKDIQHALNFEMEKYLPLPPEEYIIDFLTLETTGSSSKNLVLSLKKDRLPWITDTIKETGLRLLGVRCTEIEALNEVISKEASKGIIVVYKGERDLFTVIGVGNSVPESIKISKNRQDAETEIEKLSENYKNGTSVVGANETGLFEKFNIKAFTFSIPNLLALSGFRRRHLNLCFSPAGSAEGGLDFYPYALYSLCALSVLAFFSTTWVSYYKDTSALKTIDAQIEQIKTTASGLMETRRELETIEEKRRFLINFDQKSGRHIEVLRRLSEILPKDAWLTGFSVDEKGKIEIQGFAKRSAAIIGPLEGSPIFKNVEFSAPVTIKEKNERFSIRMVLES